MTIIIITIIILIIIITIKLTFQSRTGKIFND